MALYVELSFQIYINWMYLIFLYLAPFTLLAVFNILIYREVRRASMVRAQLSRYVREVLLLADQAYDCRNQRRELGLATMLLCVVVVLPWSALVTSFYMLVSSLPFLDTFHLVTSFLWLASSFTWK